ncbi:MAG TPA: class I SAM-dependent methyltransferase [Candidatus Paceibacterota bacterium]|nr:class I SAM-dependent methyltransferase [Candidatus Paceibacterota bacterium]
MAETFSVESYFTEHLPYDPRREIVWREIVRYLKPYIAESARVLEIGARYCHFINNVQAAKRVALDISDVVKKHAGHGVEAITGVADDLSQFQDGSFDVVLASNLFEHLEDATFQKAIGEVRRVLSKDGRLIIIQPNFRYSFRDYYDDYTHIRAFTEIGLAEELRTLGMRVEHIEPRFVPFSMAKARFSVPAWVIRAYLRSPWRPKAGQMLLVCRRA